MTRRLAAFLRALADRIAPPEPEPEVLTMAEFCQRLKDERDRELTIWECGNYLARPPLRRVK